MKQSKLFFDSMLIVGKYLQTKNDFINLMRVCSKFNNLVDAYHFNPINTNTDLFKNINTYEIYTQEEYENLETLVKKYHVILKKDFYDIDDNDNIIKISKQTISNKRVLREIIKKKDLIEVILPLGFYKLDIFDNCYNLKSLILPNDIKIITSLRNIAVSKIKIPNTVTTICDYAFLMCYRLEEIELPDNITELGEGVFCLCKSLKRIVLPRKIEYINYSAFMDCPNLTEIIVPNGFKFNYSEFEEFKNFQEGCTDSEIVNNQLSGNYEIIESDITPPTEEEFYNCNLLILDD